MLTPFRSMTGSMIRVDRTPLGTARQLCGVKRILPLFFAYSHRGLRAFNRKLRNLPRTQPARETVPFFSWTIRLSRAMWP